MIETKEYVRRRRQLMRMAGRDAIVIVPAAVSIVTFSRRNAVIGALATFGP